MRALIAWPGKRFGYSMKSSLILIFFFNSQGFHRHIVNLKISRHTLQSQISYLTDPNASVHVKYRSNKWSLSNPTHESKIGISNDMQCSNKLNTPMTYNPQLRCKLYPISNIATIKKKKIYIHTKTKQNNK
jgi:hypothetical protein